VSAANEYPTTGESASTPSLHPCEYPVDGVLCMEESVGAVWSWVDYVWLCQVHLNRQVAKGWERVDFDEDDEVEA
jgi:hypothetical protein